VGGDEKDGGAVHDGGEEATSGVNVHEESNDDSKMQQPQQMLLLLQTKRCGGVVLRPGDGDGGDEQRLLLLLRLQRHNNSRRHLYNIIYGLYNIKERESALRLIRTKTNSSSQEERGSRERERLVSLGKTTFIHYSLTRGGR